MWDSNWTQIRSQSKKSDFLRQDLKDCIDSAEQRSSGRLFQSLGLNKKKNEMHPHEQLNCLVLLSSLSLLVNNIFWQEYVFCPADSSSTQTKYSHFSYVSKLWITNVGIWRLDYCAFYQESLDTGLGCLCACGLRFKENHQAGDKVGGDGSL